VPSPPAAGPPAGDVATTQREKRLGVLLAGLLTVVVFCAYAPSLAYPFAVLDDETNFLRNPFYRGLGLEQLRWMFGTRHMGHYIPLTWLTLAGDYLLWGLDPWGYRLTSLAWHTLNALLFFGLLWRLLAPTSTRAWAALAGAALFALHPLRVESVAWISERRDVLCGAFTLLAVHAYLHWVQHRANDGTARGRRWPWLAVLLYALALLAKGVALPLPVALVALDATLLRRLPAHPRAWWRPTARGVLLEKLPFAVVGLASAALTLNAIHYVLSPLDDLGASARLALASYGLTFYAQKTWLPWPLPLPVLTNRPAQVGLLVAPFAARAAALGLALVALLLVRRRWPGLVYATLVYAAFVLPVSGLLQAGPQLVAHRYSYLAGLPWALLLAVGLTWPRGRWRPGVALCALLCLPVLAWGTRAQAGLWSDAATFCAAATQSSPHSWAPRYRLALTHLQAGRWDAGARELRLGLRARPRERALLESATLLAATCPDARVRSAGEAALLAERLQGLPGSRSPWTLYIQGAAWAEDGAFEQAQRALDAALARVEVVGAPAGVRARLMAARQLYERRQPLRLTRADWLAF
jgi:hypothetical protein